MPEFDTTITRLIQFGAHLDGPIKFPAEGKVGLIIYYPNICKITKKYLPFAKKQKKKVAVMRSPDGHMIGLSERLEDELDVDVSKTNEEASQNKIEDTSNDNGSVDKPC